MKAILCVLLLHAQNQPPEQRFKHQLDQLVAMGFSDQQANLQGQFNYKHYVFIFHVPFRSFFFEFAQRFLNR
jgi:hypothetical protein